MKKLLIWAFAVFLLAAVLAASPAFAATTGGAEVTGSSVRLRTAADTSTDRNVLLELPKGAFLLVEGQVGNWYQVVYNGMAGYVSAGYTSYSETVEGTYAYAAATTGTNVNLRSAPSTWSPIVKILPQSGAALTVTGVSGQWLHVKDAYGAAGYVRSDLVKYKPDAAAAAAVTAAGTNAGTNAGTKAAAAAQSAGDKLVQTAMLYKGYAYVWGGMSPLTGFDCSGLCNYVCSQNGITLHRVAQDIYSYDGVAVSRDELQPGDILCFGYSAWGITHVGIYIGDGQMIHASTYTTGVIVSDVDTGYYNNTFIGAKRVV